MTKAFSFLFLMLICLTPSWVKAAPSRDYTQVSNGYSSDMFIDRHWVYDRPAVPSDANRGQDMIPSVPVLNNSNADVFDHVQKTNTFGNEDMFPTRWVRTAPDRTLVIDP